MKQIKAFWKRLLSYSKRSWDLDDYPLLYKKQADITESHNIGLLKPWVVQIINWWILTGVGDTKEEAYKMLRFYFDDYKNNNQLPRPGIKVPLSFAGTAEIDTLEDLAIDFFEKVLELDYRECFISDETSLHEFPEDSSEVLQRIYLFYNLRLKDLGDGNIVRILKLIYSHKKNNSGFQNKL